MHHLLHLLWISLSLTVLAVPACADPDVSHDIDAAPYPWTQRQPDAADDKFTFAVFADLTGGEREGVFELAVSQLNLLRPEIILNVGDLIEGAPAVEEVHRQWQSFDQRAARARAPLFYVGGNHDLLGETLRDAWQERVGPRYYHFVYRNVLFLVLDTEDHRPERVTEMAQLRREALAVAKRDGWDAFYETEYFKMPENAAGTISKAQSTYMQAAIDANPDVRWTFLFMHKAPWRRPDHSPFAAIEAALAKRPYTLFHGHEHGYRYEQRYGRDYIQLATTGGVFLPDNGGAFDHVTLVTVDEQGVDIANLKLGGILDKTGKLPGRGESLCLEHADCPSQ